MENICTSQWAWGSEGFMYFFLKQSKRYSVHGLWCWIDHAAPCLLWRGYILSLNSLFTWDMISYSVLFACCTAPTLLIRLVWHVKVMNGSRICLLQVAVLSGAFEQLSEDGYLPSAVVAVVMLLVVLNEFALKRKVSWEERFSLDADDFGEDTSLHLYAFTSQRPECAGRTQTRVVTRFMKFGPVLLWSVSMWSMWSTPRVAEPFLPCKLILASTRRRLKWKKK